MLISPDYILKPVTGQHLTKYRHWYLDILKVMSGIKNSKALRAPFNCMIFMVYKWWNCTKGLKGQIQQQASMYMQQPVGMYVWMSKVCVLGRYKQNTDQRTKRRMLEQINTDVRQEQTCIWPEGTWMFSHRQVTAPANKHTHMKSGCTAHGASSGKLTQAKTRSEQHRHRNTIHLYTIQWEQANPQHYDFSFDS